MQILIWRKDDRTIERFGQHFRVLVKLTRTARLFRCFPKTLEILVQASLVTYLIYFSGDI